MLSSAAQVAVLFNTLAYAQFFALVFVATWLLVDRRMVLALPWLGLTAYALFAARSVESFLLLVPTGLITLGITLREPARLAPRPTAIALSWLVNGSALAWLTWRTQRSDPFTLGCRALGVPIERGYSSLGLPAVPAGLFVFAAVALVLGVVARHQRVRLLFLLGASYVFYAHWDYRFLPLIWGSSTADYLLGQAIGNATHPTRRRLWLWCTVVVNLSVLGFFKYYNFGIDSARALLHEFGIYTSDSTLAIALPVGISFFTFESMSYVIDVYRKQIEPHDSYLEYLGFVAFFPHLVAGPIVRPRDLLPQLRNHTTFDPELASDGLYLIATGLMKKVMIADPLATNLVDRVFDAPLQYSGLEAYVAVVAYALQIYCDFSGYTDIAIGSAQLLGIKFPVNFNSPYQATSIADFWHRWHISLSTWLRDYLYISLGGNRKGPVRTYVNNLLTMLLGGLWHGASWTFVAWGAIHGVALALTRAIGSWRGNRPRLSEIHPLLRYASVFVTFHVVCIAWVFFRAETFGKAALMFARMASGTWYHPNLHPQVLGILALGLAAHFIPSTWDRALRASFVRLPAPAQGVCLFLTAVLLRQLASTEAVPFVYFQF